MPCLLPRLVAQRRGKRSKPFSCVRAGPPHTPNLEGICVLRGDARPAGPAWRIEQFAVAGLPLTAGQPLPTLGAGVVPPLPGPPCGATARALRGESEMPAPRSPEFRRRAVELARLRDKPIAQTARDPGDRRIMSAQRDGPDRRRGGLVRELAARSSPSITACFADHTGGSCWVRRSASRLRARSTDRGPLTTAARR